MKYTLFFCAVCCFFIPAEAQSIDTLNKIDQLFTHWNNATPGGSILVAKGEKIIYHKAFGLADLEHNVPNTTETIFEAGSVSKQFTAASILLLVSEGKLSTQDDVRKYVPELPQYDSPILIQYLLNHTSGLKDWGVVGSLTGWPRTTRIYTQELALDIICKQKSLNFSPGTQYSYSNSNYSLLVTIVERISKQTLAEFTETRFFKPMGMTHTKWRDDFREIIPNRAIAYDRTPSGYEQMMPFENVHGHGGLLTTTGDLLKWNSLLETHTIGGNPVYALRVQQGKLKNGKQIHYAGGLSIGSFNTFKEISHSGATAGYRAWLAYYPEKKITIAVLSNDDHGDVVGIGKRIAGILVGNPKSDSKKPESIVLSETELKKFTGMYKNTQSFDGFNINYKDGKLEWTEGNVITIHRDTLYSNGIKLAYQKSGNINLIKGQDVTLYRKVNAPDLTIGNLKSFAGTYYSKDADTQFTITIKDNEVWINRGPATSYKLEPLFYDAFGGDEFGMLEFKRDKKGKVTGFEISQSRAENVPFVKITQTK